jgi:arginyl-tRNA synthetase
MLKFSRGKLIVFDIEEALIFEGETGPYLQYAVVRANNIFHKLQEREALSERDIVGVLDRTPAEELEGDSALWDVVFEAARLDDVVEQVVRSLEFSALAKYAFGLAQMFNAFYHRYSILNEEDVARKRWRAAGVAYFRAQVTRALDLAPSEAEPIQRGSVEQLRLVGCRKLEPVDIAAGFLLAERERIVGAHHHAVDSDGVGA